MWVNIPHSCFYLSPLFQLERLQPNMLFTPPVSPAPCRCSINLWRGPVAIAPWFLYRLYMQNGCRSDFFNTRLYGLAVLTSDVCTHRRNIFSFIHINRRASVSVSVGVCKKNCAFWNEGRCYSVYDKVLRTLYIRALLICVIIPVCTLLLIFKILCYFLYQILNSRIHKNDDDDDDDSRKKKQITSFLPNGGKNSSGMTIIVMLCCFTPPPPETQKLMLSNLWCSFLFMMDCFS